jgi:hypothetical protein
MSCKSAFAQSNIGRASALPLSYQEWICLVYFLYDQLDGKQLPKPMDTYGDPAEN